LDLIKENMNKEELSEILTTVWEEVKEIYRYASSALGIMKSITTDYDALNLEADSIQEKISNPENLTLLKDVLTKLG